MQFNTTVGDFQLPEGINKLKVCRYGPMVYNKHDFYIGRSLELYGEFSELETNMFRQIVRPGATVLDVGANIGCHTVPLARMVGPQGEVWAFEPQRIVFQTLCANVALNSLQNVRCLQQALGRERGMVMVPPCDYTRQNNFGGMPMQKTGAGEPVALGTIDELRLARCQLIKIDVEGMEAEVIEGARETIARCRPFLYVENDRKERSDDLIRLIASLGYTMYWDKPPLFNPENFFRNQENVFGRIVSINMLCAPSHLQVSVPGATPIPVP